MKNIKKAVLIAAIIVIVIGVIMLIRASSQGKVETASVFVMDTTVSQKAYGRNALSTMEEVNQALKQFEQEVSAYMPQSDIWAINAAAGKTPVTIKPRTLALLMQAKELSQNSDNTFAITVAPLSMAWGITSSSPRVVLQGERNELLKLVDDSALVLTSNTAQLMREGQGIDLGGIAKGTACEVAKEIYKERKVKYALLNVGGSCIYVKGVKPDGTKVRIGFRDPLGDENASIASFELTDMVFSSSGGYERFFEQDGVKYHHILDLKTGAPAQSDIVSLGVMHEDGTQADFLSTSLFVKGKDKTLEYMQNGGIAIMLDDEKNIYVSAKLKNSFELADDAPEYTVVFI